MSIFPKKPLTWIILVVIAYAYVVSSRQPKNPSPSPKKVEKAVPDSIQLTTKAPDEKNKYLEGPANKAVEMMQKSTTGNTILEKIISKALQDQVGKDDIAIAAARHSGEIRSFDTVLGIGEGVYCGSTVTVHYNSFLPGNIKSDSTRDRGMPITFKAGAGRVIRGLEHGVVGMKKGGFRKITIPAKYAYDDPRFKGNVIPPDSILYYDVELIAVKNGANDNSAQLQIIDEMDGMDDKVICGSNVTLQYQAFNLDDSPIGGKSSRSVSFRLGDGVVPVGLEKGIIGMALGGVRTVVVPPPLMKNLSKKNALKEIKLPKTKSVVFKVELTGTD